MDVLLLVAAVVWFAGCANRPAPSPTASGSMTTTTTTTNSTPRTPGTNVLLTGSQLPVPATPTSAALLGTRVYTQEEMQRWGSVSLDDFLRRVPGVRVDGR